MAATDNMNETMDFQSPGHPMRHLLLQGVGDARQGVRAMVEQKPVGWADVFAFSGVVAGLVLLIVILDRWERRKMKAFWNGSMKGINHHAQHQKTSEEEQCKLN